VKYAFIEQELSTYPVVVACEALEVSPAGYHAWRGRPEAPRTRENRALSAKMKQIFLASGKTYGAPRVAAELREAHGYRGSVNRIKRLMSEAGLRARAKRKFKATTDSKHSLPTAPNRLQQNFVAEQPNQAWLSDITYVWTQEGWLYLCCILDLFNREIVGWSMQPRMRQDIVLDALAMAKFRRRPTSGLIFHSDRGSQYASAAVRAWLGDHHIQQSMSGTGNCYDNAPMESFWHTLKVERVHGAGYATREEAKRDVFSYVEGFYNCLRRHSTLGFLSPREFARRHQLRGVLSARRNGTNNSSTKT
jgi:putative transposase